ncbi:MAG: dihydroorotate dehydrogenase electron transfer subunit [Acholeplasmatales bacterium]|nr:dihydroorotate dehydrogenase electron transfer subunit [Acholeplasmatales bacterium]
MNAVDLKVLENKQINNDIYLIKLEGDTSEIKNSGEFAELKLDNYYLRRPLSIHDYDSKTVSFLYKVLGHGTRDLTRYKKGDVINTILGLGNGFNDLNAISPLLIGGGIGMAPLLNLAKRFNEKNIRPNILLGFKNINEVCYVEEFKKYGDVYVTTDDGSFGYCGNPVSFLQNNNLKFDKYYACGPLVMLKYLTKYSTLGYVSLEARMGCGIGACMGCSIETKNGIKRVCKEGPVFDADEVNL